MTPSWYQLWTHAPDMGGAWLFLGWYYATVYEMPWLKSWLSCEGIAPGTSFVILNQDGSPSFEKSC